MMVMELHMVEEMVNGWHGLWLGSAAAGICFRVANHACTPTRAAFLGELLHDGVSLGDWVGRLRG
jgi:hypothetical protein